MARVRVHCYSMSRDGFVAGPNQSLLNPIGEGADEIHGWIFETAGGQRLIGGDPADGSTGVDDDLFAAGFDGIGATIMGRNMFGPIRGPWLEPQWTGWWGDEPPFHHEVFVLTHWPRPDEVLEGGTTFHFVTGGVHEALERATEAAGDLDIRLGGGARTIRQFLAEGLIDEFHLVRVPVDLGAGERIDTPDAGAGLKGMTLVEAIDSGPIRHERYVR